MGKGNKIELLDKYQSVLGTEGVAKEFSKSIQKNRHNYFPQVQHFFNLYFSKNVPEYPFS